MVHRPFLHLALDCPIVGVDRASGTQVVGATEALPTVGHSSLAQLGNRPLDAGSAGLSIPFTCCQRLGGTDSITSDTQFPTNVLNRRGFPRNQLRTTQLSVQAWMLLLGI